MDPITHSRLLKLSVAAMLSLSLGACITPSNAGVATLGEGAEDESGENTKDAEAELQKWAECMRENGIDIPDASVDGNGGMRIERRIEAGDAPPAGGAVRLSDDFGEAIEECGEPPRTPGAGPSEEDLKEMQDNALKLAQCMRDEGIADFPDPDFSNSGPGAAPGVRVMAGGPFGGDVDMDDPDVQAAFEACREEVGDGPMMFRFDTAERAAN